jgi:hypothetical protein
VSNEKPGPTLKLINYFSGIIFGYFREIIGKVLGLPLDAIKRREKVTPNSEQLKFDPGIFGNWSEKCCVFIYKPKNEHARNKATKKVTPNSDQHKSDPGIFERISRSW